MTVADVRIGVEEIPTITSELHPYLARFRALICGIARNKIVAGVRGQDAPSTSAKCSNLRIIQTPGHIDAIYNNRPPELTGPPIQIYHPVFATFIRELFDTTTTLLPRTLDMARELIDVSLEFYESELQRKAQLQKLKFWDSISIESTDYILDKSAIHPDGSITVHPPDGHRTAILIVELKNEIGEGSSDPIMQSERSWASICCSSMVGLFLPPYRSSTEGPCTVRPNPPSLVLSSDTGWDRRPVLDRHWSDLQ
jgi:hypothetical protein